VFKKIKDTFKEVYKGEGLMNDFCEHLRQIGINATLLESGSPETIPSLVRFALGSVKVEDRNIDFIQVNRTSTGGGEDSGPSRLMHLYHYLVRANVEALEDKLKAKLKPIKKGFLSKEVVDFKWEGGELAQMLNADSDLKNKMLKEWLNPLVRPIVEIKPHKKHRCVWIMQTTERPVSLGPSLLMSGAQGLREIGRKTFPTREDFEIYDRIAQHIRSITSAWP